MPDFVTLTCPSCGGKLQITKDIERFACSNCGNEHIVNRAGGIISLSPVVAGLKSIQTGVDKTAAELAIARLKAEINQLGDPIAASEVVNLLSKNIMRRVIFLQAFNKMRGIKQSIFHRYSEKEFAEAFSAISDDELVNIASILYNPLQEKDVAIITSTLQKVLNNRKREKKLKELEKYYAIVNDSMNS